MTVEWKFSSHLVPEEHRVRRPLVSLNIFLSFGGMNLLTHVLRHKHAKRRCELGLFPLLIDVIFLIN
jgi:hypothetical protein